jgi:beta-lactam-binding protein with PASTA domain
MKLDEAKEILKNNGFLVEYDIPVRSNVNIGDRLSQIKKRDKKVPTNKVYIVVMDGGESDDDYAVFTSMLEAHKWGDENCKNDYTVKTSKMF